MIFSTPVKFDENEWFVLTGLIIFLIIFWRLPKHFPPALTFMILLFTVNLGITADYILATNFPFNAYDALDTAQFDLFDFIMSNINYGLFGYVFIYFYDKWHVTGLIRFLYIAFWIFLSVVMEYIATKLNVFTYNDWNLGYSFICYLFIFAYYILVLKIGKAAFNQYKNNSFIRER
jgi:hypothetical protein